MNILLKSLRIILLGGGLAALIFLETGCITTYDGSTRREVYEREDEEIVNEKLRRMEGDLESFAAQLDNLRADISRVQANSATTTQTQVAALQSNLQVLQQQLADLEAQRIRDREEIINKLTDKIARLVTAAPPRPDRPGTPSQYGFEHTVDTGQSLSKIAAAYGVSMESIVRANNLNNPNNLRIGQKLFIPE